MSEPINLPPLTMKVLMEVFGSHADIPPALLSTSWKDGIDIDVTSMRAQMLVEAYAGLAVEQATAELRAERDALRADAERYAYVLANARRIDICRVSLVDTNMDQLSARIDAALKEAK